MTSDYQQQVKKARKSYEQERFRLRLKHLIKLKKLKTKR